MKNDYYEKNGKLNPQIAVAKNNKSVIETLDRLKFEDSSAQVESSFSRVRIGIQDFSGKPSKYAWANMTPEEIRTAYDNLCNLNASPAVAYEVCQNDMLQIMQMLTQNPGISPNELGFVDAKLRENYARIEQAKKMTVLFEEKKILPYDNYRNPNNSGEHLITGLKIVYNPEMRVPVIFEVSQGYGVAQRDDTGRVKYGGEHDTITLKKFLTISEAKSFLGKTVRFCDAMAAIATRRYYELKLSGLCETASNEASQQAGYVPYQPQTQEVANYPLQDTAFSQEQSPLPYPSEQFNGQYQTPYQQSAFSGTAFEGLDTLYGQ